MPVAQLTNPNRVTTPAWLQDDSAGQSLRNVQSNLGQYFDTSGLKSSFDQSNAAFANRYEMGVDAQARAAKNQAARGGGQVGANFTKGQLMLGLQSQMAGQQTDYARLAAQMMANQGQLAGQLAGQQANYGLGRQGLLANWTQGQQGLGLDASRINQQAALARAQMQLDRERMAQQGGQFDRSFTEDARRFDKSYGLQQQGQQSRNALAALQAMGPGGFSANLDPRGQPLSGFDAQMWDRSQNFTNQRNSYLSQLMGGSVGYGG